MSGSEIVTLVLRTLSSGEPKSAPEIGALLRQSGNAGYATDSKIFDVLSAAEQEGLVERLHPDSFDDLRPVSTTSWRLRPDKLNAVLNPPKTAGVPIYIDDAKIVASQPIFLSNQGVDLGSIGTPVMDVREAMERIVLDATDDLRIACPYYDELFLEVLSRSAQRVRNLRNVFVMSESMDPILVKATHLFPNMRVKTVQRTVRTGGRDFKVQGVHAKLMIADRSEVLIGSFNFRFSHILYNIDLGLLAKGRVAEDYVKIFDSIWGR